MKLTYKPVEMNNTMILVHFRDQSIHFISIFQKIKPNQDFSAAVGANTLCELSL